MNLTHQSFVARKNAEILRISDTGKASPHVLIALFSIFICIAALSRADAYARGADLANKKVDELQAELFAKSHDAFVLADLMNGARYKVDGKVLHCHVK